MAQSQRHLRSSNKEHFAERGYADENSNQLAKVTEGAGGNDHKGFIDGNKTGDDYGYDANGNMTSDKNKNITKIEYNHLNLPKKITFGTTGTIEYIYNAAGQKLEKIVTDNSVVTNTNYLGGFQYKDNVLQFFPTAEGYVKNDSGVLSYVFQYKDHLGNVRVSYAKNPVTQVLEILEENNYYPFGLKHNGYNDYLPTNNKYKYNGKELQDELGLGAYDYGFRNYMPDIGRWFNVDPLSEKYYNTSPYVYVKNKPLNTIDPDGRYLFGLFGSSASERRTARAEQYAQKVSGSVVVGANGRPSVNTVSTNSAGEMVLTSKSNFGDFSSWKNVGQTLKGFDAALEGHGGNEYTGVKGMREFGEDLGKGSTYVKAGGVVVGAAGVVTAQPEIVATGVGIYKVGDGMDKVANGLQITADLSQGKGGDAAIRLTGLAVGQIAGSQIDSKVTNEAVKLAATSIIDQSIDTAKDQALKQNSNP